MEDEELDQLLAQSAPAPPAQAAQTAVLMARESATSRRSTSRRRRLVVIAGVTGGGALLAAAGTVSAYQLSIPPFLTTDSGTVRIDRGIPVEYTNSLGRRVDCLAFMEFEKITDEQQDELKKVAASPEWSGYGERVLDDLNIPAASPTPKTSSNTSKPRPGGSRFRLPRWS